MPQTFHVVVDGSNLATEGRTLPSLRQLEEAITAYEEEHPGAEMIVVVDATFEHRIDGVEVKRFKAAELRGEFVSPPAGAIGRGDAFVLQIAKRANAVVLSNDSFQEFHGEHPWLFEEGRLIGGKPIPAVGWIFTPRNPVRGAKSRAATNAVAKKAGPVKKLSVARPDGTKPKVGDTLIPAGPKPVRVHELARELGIESKDLLELAKKAKVAATSHSSMLEPAQAVKVRSAFKVRKLKAQTVAEQMGVELAELKDIAASLGIKISSAASSVIQADLERLSKAVTARAKRTEAVAKVSAMPAQSDASISSGRNRRRGRRRGGAKPVETDIKPASVAPTNSPLDLLTFLATYELGSQLTGTVSTFTSHGAMIDVALTSGSRFTCYVATANLGDPAPAKARDVLAKGEVATFEILALDAARRVAELRLVGGSSATTSRSTKRAPNKAAKKSAPTKPAPNKSAATKAAKKSALTKPAPKKPAPKKSAAKRTTGTSKKGGSRGGSG